jgi:hypothetical protein
VPYSLELVAEQGPLPHTEVLLEWLRDASPAQSAPAPTLSQQGDRLALEIPFRIEEPQARALAAAALRAARELRLAAHDPQLGRCVGEGDLEAVVRRWRELSAVVPAPAALQPQRRGFNGFHLAALAALVLLALFGALVLSTIGLFASMVESDQRLHPGEYRDGQE